MNEVRRVSASGRKPLKKRGAAILEDINYPSGNTGISSQSSPASTATLDSTSSFRLTPHPRMLLETTVLSAASQHSYGDTSMLSFSEGLSTQQPQSTASVTSPALREITPRAKRTNETKAKSLEIESEFIRPGLNLTRKAATFKKRRPAATKERELVDIASSPEGDAATSTIKQTTKKPRQQINQKLVQKEACAKSPVKRSAGDKKRRKPASEGQELDPPIAQPAKKKKPTKKEMAVKPPNASVEATKIKKQHNSPNPDITQAKETQILEQQKPAKKKRKKLTFQDQVYNHMLNSFKPFTTKTLAGELKTTSEALNYVMLSLVDKALVIQKDFASKKGGRVRTLYWVNHGTKVTKEVQLQFEKATPTGMENTRREISSLQAQQVTLQRTLEDTNKKLSNEELASKLSQEGTKMKSLTESLAATKRRIREGATQQQKGALQGRKARLPTKTPAQLARERCPRRLQMRINAMRAEWKSRKDKCVEFLEQLADGLEKKPKEVVKLLEIETDEAEGVTLPPKRAIPDK